MARKVPNRHIYGAPEALNDAQEELEWLGRWDLKRVDANHLVVFALPLKHKRNKKDRDRAERRDRKGNGHERERQVDN